jgi:hypothetical protein
MQSNKRHNDFLFALLFDIQNAGDMFLRSNGSLSMVYMALHPIDRTLHNHLCENLKSYTHYHVYKNLQLVSIPSQMNPVHLSSLRYIFILSCYIHVFLVIRFLQFFHPKSLLQPSWVKYSPQQLLLKH